MRNPGLESTEISPGGYLPADPRRLAGTLTSYDLKAVGGFTRVLLHDALTTTRTRHHRHPRGLRRRPGRVPPARRR